VTIIATMNEWGHPALQLTHERMQPRMSLFAEFQTSDPFDGTYFEGNQGIIQAA
jgi:hypothetical protein